MTPTAAAAVLFVAQSISLSTAFSFPSWTTSTASIPAAIGETALSQVHILASRFASKGGEISIRPHFEDSILDYAKASTRKQPQNKHHVGDDNVDYSKLLGTGGTVMVRPANTNQKQVWTALKNLERDS
jgi:parvulin-like peptidyl-prolyl isomerase